jgi:hypothetical protein
MFAAKVDPSARAPTRTAVPRKSFMGFLEAGVLALESSKSRVGIVK